MNTDEPLTPFTENVWIATIPIKILGMQLTVTMGVLRLENDQLLVYSPVTLTSERRSAIEKLGEVKHLYAPNTFHHLFLHEWIEAYPNALVHAPKDLKKKRPDIHIHREHGTKNHADFDGFVEEIVIQGFRLRESVLIHIPSNTLLLADLVHNIGTPKGVWTRIYSGMMGFYDKVALSRIIRWTAFDDKQAAQKSLQTLVASPFDKIIVGHGQPIHSNAKESIQDAYSWLLDRSLTG